MLLALVTWASNARAQLAITEVMAVPAINTNTAFWGPDYWELTNFGTNDINLTGYSFSDNHRTNLLVRTLFANLIIHVGESIVFFELQSDRTVSTAEQFRAWWGTARLPPHLQIRSYKEPGFNARDGDEVWLYDPHTNVVDMVVIGGGTRMGRALVYDADSGIFGVPSLAGVDGAFTAVLSVDVGSPGTAIGPVPLQIIQQPMDQTADAGAPTALSVKAVGMPQPKFQWLAKGVAIPGVCDASLTLPNVQPSDAGEYRVRVFNGLMELTSGAATLTVNTNPTPPALVEPPADATVFAGQTAVFQVVVRGYPSPLYQWRCNGVEIPGATNALLTVPNVEAALSGAQYSVRCWNSLGTTNASATLMVRRRPRLQFTEVMPLAKGPFSRHYDWFELTNGDTEPVDLRGYRFSDTPSLACAQVITNSVIVQPGESVVFVERMSRAEFVNWWGASRLPPNLQVITYLGFSLKDGGETLHLWNAAATDLYDTVATASWASALAGVSLACDNDCYQQETYGCNATCLTDSVDGFSGAFRAAELGDVGSPGYTSNPPPRICSLVTGAGETILECRVVSGRTYRLDFTPTLSEPAWQTVGTYGATNCILRIPDAFTGGALARFYRLEEIP